MPRNVRVPRQIVSMKTRRGSIHSGRENEWQDIGWFVVVVPQTRKTDFLNKFTEIIIKKTSLQWAGDVVFLFSV